MKKLIPLLIIIILLISCNKETARYQTDNHEVDTTSVFNGLSNINYAKDREGEEEVLSPSEYGILIDDQINPEYLEQNEAYVTRFVEAARKNNGVEIRKLINRLDTLPSMDKMKISSLLLSELNAILMDADFEIERVFYNKLDKGHFEIESTIHESYHHKYSVLEGEQLTSLIKVKNHSNVEYLILDLTKDGDEWVLSRFNNGAFKKDERSSFDWLALTNKLVKEDEIMTALLTNQMTLMILPPDHYPMNAHVNEAFEVQKDLMELIDEKYMQSPIYFKDIETNPQVYVMLPDLWHKESNFGTSVHYQTSIDLNDKEAISQEAHKIHENIVKDFDTDIIEHFTYVAYQTIPERMDARYLDTECAVTIID